MDQEVGDVPAPRVRAVKSGRRVAPVSDGREATPVGRSVGPTQGFLAATKSVNSNTASKSANSTTKSVPYLQNNTPSHSRDRSRQSIDNLQNRGNVNPRPSFPSSSKTPSSGKKIQPARILSSAVRNQESQPHPQPHGRRSPTLKGLEIVNTKSSKPLLPTWQELDRDNEERMRIQKRAREDDGLELRFAKRKSIQTKRRGVQPNTPLAEKKNLSKSVLTPNMKLKTDGVSESSSSEEEVAQNQNVGVKTPAFGTNKVQVAVKKFAARKLESTPISSSEDSDSSSSSSSSTEGGDELDEPGTPPPAEEEDVEMEDEQEIFPEIILLDSPPQILIPLPQLDLDTMIPPVELVAAVEALTLSSVRMQKTRQLPFQLRNLRKGFFARCRDLLVPIYGDGRKVELTFQYDHIADVSYKTNVSEWVCPLCDLLGTLRTREMLDCHLQWDHPEVYCEWELREDTEEFVSFKLTLVIPEVLQPARTPQDESASVGQPTFSGALEDDVKTPLRSQTPFSPFPYVALSPASASRSRTAPSRAESPVIHKVEPYNHPSIRARTPGAPTASTTSQSVTLDPPTSSSARSRSITTTTSTAPRTPYPITGVIPPPFDNRLGPAAQLPYLPAVSDYGGPTVYYSCRTGGPCLFDLLNTLPMHDFGLLDWEVLDREDEIYDSDDVKEEYKVMHALWARWIMLNRNTFIANYHKGAQAFINDYWKMIHRAAGWDALRYWLLMLLANQFLTGRDVAKLLTHYESLTGMDSWYDD